MMSSDFKEVAIELRNITHSFESDFSIKSLLKKRKYSILREPSQPKINQLNHLNQNAKISQISNKTINAGNNVNLNGVAHLNGGLNKQPSKEEVQMIYLNQSKNFPSFYFAQNENNNYESYDRNAKSSSLSQDSFSKKLNPDLDTVSDPKKNVLNSLHMTIPKGSIYGLLGPSGCGKTTLLKVMMGIIKPHKGTVNVFNCDPTSGFGNVPGHDCGYMPQDYSLHDDLTIKEMLYYFGKIYRMDKELIKIKVKELINLLDLPSENQLISTLSGGQKRRASFCCAVIHLPKLLILDEPTVGCDPLLRERIWSLLVDFSLKFKTTIIITTHYIEEAKRSSLVGFMKKGCIMAENTPENLFKNYSTKSLETIFYNLCINEKRKLKNSTLSTSPKTKGSFSYDNKSIKKVKRTSSPNLYDEKDKIKNFYFYNKELEPSSIKPVKKTYLDSLKTFSVHLKALCVKQIIYSMRKPETTVAQFVVPLIVVMFFCVCVGSLPKDIPIGIYNQENCTTNDICLSEDLITYLNSYALKKIRYDNLTDAMRDAKSRKLFGILKFGPNFTEAFIDKLHFDNSSKIVNQSVVTFNGDMTNSVLIAIFENIFYSDYYDFVQYALTKMEIKQSYGNLPVTIGTEVFGRYVKRDYSAINAYAAPGLLIIIVYSVSFALTGLSLLTEKTNGVFERNCVSGVTTNSMLISHLLINMAVFAVGLLFLLQMTTKLYDIPVRGSFIAGYLILLLQCFTGLGNGLLLSAIMNSIWGYAVVGNGILLFIFITSGALWPLESMPFYLNWLSYFLPSTLAIESLRSILVRGISITVPIVYLGFLSSIIWSILMIVGSAILFKWKQKLGF